MKTNLGSEIYKKIVIPKVFSISEDAEAAILLLRKIYTLCQDIEIEEIYFDHTDEEHVEKFETIKGGHSLSANKAGETATKFTMDILWNRNYFGKDKTAIEKDLKEIYITINDLFKSVREKIYLLKTFSVPLYSECDNKLQAIFDVYIDAINEAIAKKCKPYVNSFIIQRNKGDIFSALYKWANDFAGREE